MLLNKIVFTLAACLSLSSAAMAKDYDVVILGGRVMDPETLYDDIANVGIKDGRIAAITKKSISGEQSIDATGHVVAPASSTPTTTGSERWATSSRCVTA